MDKKKRLRQLINDIKSVKIQGATNVAKAALTAYELSPNKKTKNLLLETRPTEPMMVYALNLAEKLPANKILAHFGDSQQKINKTVFNLIKKDKVILTHCHSTNVSQALIFSHKKGAKFEVYTPETRPLYQGRKTAKELSAAGIKVTFFADSSIENALAHEDGFQKIDKILLGADALSKKGIINKIGSGLIAHLAADEKIPFYIVADSWKFSSKKIPLEQRPLNEIWNKAPKNVKIKNPAFEFVDKKYLSGIVTELGLTKYDKFVKKMS